MKPAAFKRAAMASAAVVTFPAGVSVVLISISCLKISRAGKTVVSPGAAMTAWLANDDVPHGFSIDQETELQSPVEEKATVRFVRHALEPKEVQRHIAAGKQCTRLALTWANRVSFILIDSMVLKRVLPVDVIREGEAAQAQNDDERFDADFTLMAGELHHLMTDLVDALGGLPDAEQK